MTAKTEELKKLIEESENKIKKQEELIKEINNKLSSKKEEISLAEKELLKFKPVKILSKKEMEKAVQEKCKGAKEEEEKEKHTIWEDTRKAFEKAKNIRTKALTQTAEEQEKSEISAAEIEMEALKKKAKVLSEISCEKQVVYEDLLARRVCENSNLKQILIDYIDDCNSRSAKEIIYKTKNNIKTLNDKILQLDKEIRNLNSEIEKATKEADIAADKLKNK